MYAMHMNELLLDRGYVMTYLARVPTLIIIVMISALTACGNVSEKKKMTNLEESVTSYEIALRWAEHESAYSYHVNEEGVKPETDLERLKEISVTGIEVMEKLVHEDKDKAKVRMNVKYYFKDEGKVKTLKLEHDWWYSEENKQWFIKSDFPNF